MITLFIVAMTKIFINGRTQKTIFVQCKYMIRLIEQKLICHFSTVKIFMQKSMRGGLSASIEHVTLNEIIFHPFKH